MQAITVIGAGLAGAEASWQLAQAGLHVTLREMKPARRTPAQVSPHFAELVCSNSLRSRNLSNAVGLLKDEMARLGSLVLRMAYAYRVPAGDALAVEREPFGAAITQALCGHPRISVVPGVVERLPGADAGPHVIATGPLTDDALAQDIAARAGGRGLYFYDAIAPILAADSIDRSIVFAASRWDKGDGADYLNCPLDQAQYRALVAFLCQAECMPAHAFETAKYFQGCLPVEVMAASGPETLRFGPLKPVGLTDPRTGRWPYAVVQLRAEDCARQAYNLVGLQTKLKHPEQRRLLQLIPGLHGAEVLRYGAMHRNTYLNSPELLDARLRLRSQTNLRFAGQITGVEGYVESAACGLVAALLILGERKGDATPPPPPETALGALLGHVIGAGRLPGRAHEPQNVNWAMFPPIASAAPRGRKGRPMAKLARVARAQDALEAWATEVGQPLAPRAELADTPVASASDDRAPVAQPFAAKANSALS